jgi:hypothetical protein
MVDAAARELARIAPGRVAAARVVQPAFQQGRSPVEVEQEQVSE